MENIPLSNHNLFQCTPMYLFVCIFVSLRARETYLKPFNTEETEHEGEMGNVVISQRVGVQVLTGRRRCITDQSQ